MKKNGSLLIGQVTFTLLLLMLVTSVFAQKFPGSVLPEDYSSTQSGDAGIQITNENEDLLQKLYLCNGMAGGIHQDLYGHNRQWIRAYGFDSVPAQDFRLDGPASIGIAMRRAELKAKNNAAIILEGFAIDSNTILDDGSKKIDEGLANGESISRKLSRTTVTTFEEVIVQGVSSFMKYGVPAGNKVISLGDGFGYCAASRFDIPLDQTTPPPTQQDRNGVNNSIPSTTTTVTIELAPIENEDTGYQQVPAGEAGDW